MLCLRKCPVETTGGAPESYGVCRICVAEVDAGGRENLTAAYLRPASQNTVVMTRTLEFRGNQHRVGPRRTNQSLLFGPFLLNCFHFC